MKKGEVEGLLTITEVSNLLKVHPNTLRLWDKKGVLKAIRFGIRGDRRYTKSDIEKITMNLSKHENEQN